MWTILEVLIEFVTILLPLSMFWCCFWPHKGMWPNLPTRVSTHTLFIGRWNLTLWPQDVQISCEREEKLRKQEKASGLSQQMCVWTECLLVGPWFSSVGERQLCNAQTRTHSICGNKIKSVNMCQGTLDFLGWKGTRQIWGTVTDGSTHRLWSFASHVVSIWH